jgi:UDP-2,4-diacetamido-2,4,6-trideoxy-beta-L-altropyranose hydrolase
MMRCLTLAEQLRAKKCDVTFVARAHPGNMDSAVAEKSFRLIELPAPPHTGAPVKDADYPAWLGVSQDQDAQETLAATGGNHFDWLVVDHYSLDAQWEAQMRAKARKIMAIDDLANRPHDCDVLLDQNFHPDPSTRYESLIPPTASRFIGPQYALLRKEFYEAKKTLRKRRGEIKRVLVCMGGSDPDNVTGEVVGALLDQRFSHLETQVVVGASNSHLQSIEAQIEGRGNFRVLTDVQNMAMLMAESDFAIGAGGVMLLERLYMELPSLVIPIAPNQLPGINAVKELRITTLFLESKRDEFLFGNYLADVLDKTQSKRGTEDILGCDGVGNKFRVVVDLLSGQLSRPVWNYRFATLGDADLLWIWANDPEVRQGSISQEYIPFEEHLSWFENALDSQDVSIAICECELGPIGYVRIARQGGRYEISYLMGRQLRELGWSAEMLSGGIRFWQGKTNVPDGYILVARVKTTNRPSQRVFTKLGFEVESEERTKDVLTFVSR